MAKLPWFCNPRVMRQNAKRYRLLRKGLVPKNKAELRELAASLAPRGCEPQTRESMRGAGSTHTGQGPNEVEQVRSAPQLGAARGAPREQTTNVP